ncbi:MAG TPA: PTS transporter subunit EIIC [Bacilli bacterium]
MLYKFGRLLSTIVSQNIAVIIAIGLLRAIFGVYGWFPNSNVDLLTEHLLNWMVPVMFGYSGGQLLGGKRGGAVAAVVIFALALASTVSMIFMAFILGPLLGYIVNRIERILEKRLPSGFELLMSNFISAILAGALAVYCFSYGGQAISSMIESLNNDILQIAYSGWLPISALLIEPAKILFLNNMMSYGILGPLGIAQIDDLSKSVYFLLEANPGPAMGLLLAFIFRRRGKSRRNAASTLAIHSLGGIQEVYFPYVLARPILLLPLIIGSFSGIYVFHHFDSGLVSIPSPPSLFLLIGLSPPGDVLYVLFGIAVSAAVSFFLALPIIKPAAEKPEPAAADAAGTVPGISPANSCPGKYTICFACDAGMGSSAMGAAILRKKLRSLHQEESFTVIHSSLDQIPPDADMIVTHHYLLKQAISNAPGREYMSLENYTDPSAYEAILEKLRQLGVTS